MWLVLYQRLFLTFEGCSQKSKINCDKNCLSFIRSAMDGRIEAYSLLVGCQWSMLAGPVSPVLFQNVYHAKSTFVIIVHTNNCQFLYLLEYRRFGATLRRELSTYFAREAMCLNTMPLRWILILICLSLLSLVDTLNCITHSQPKQLSMVLMWISFAFLLWFAGLWYSRHCGRNCFRIIVCDVGSSPRTIIYFRPRKSDVQCAHTCSVVRTKLLVFRDKLGFLMRKIRWPRVWKTGITELETF